MSSTATANPDTKKARKPRPTGPTKWTDETVRSGIADVIVAWDNEGNDPKTFPSRDFFSERGADKLYAVMTRRDPTREVSGLMNWANVYNRPITHLGPRRRKRLDA